MLVWDAMIVGQGFSMVPSVHLTCLPGFRWLCLEVHSAAIRPTAANNSPPEIINQWAAP
jgi:hypothetical protein